MFCKACGNEVLDTSVICPKCGSATGGADVVPAPLTPGWLWAGWLSAAFLPLFGIILGIIIAAKFKQLGHGLAMVAVSILAWIFWAAFMMGAMGLV